PHSWSLAHGPLGGTRSVPGAPASGAARLEEATGVLPSPAPGPALASRTSARRQHARSIASAIPIADRLT
ncbi:MAG TPA: hypothetical protein VE782_03695, partial [Myxococcaceae bacterium]|nr:hypothetical protein [Myxococcaceae bacterium]